MKYNAKAYRTRHKPGTMNHTEKRFSLHLDLLKKSGEVLDWAYEPEKLRIAENCHFTPDFRAIKKYANSEGFGEYIVFYEVKSGWKVKGKRGVVKPHIECDALVKLKAAAELHPYKFILVWEDSQGFWEMKEFN